MESVVLATAVDDGVLKTVFVRVARALPDLVARRDKEADALLPEDDTLIDKDSVAETVCENVADLRADRDSVTGAEVESESVSDWTAVAVSVTRKVAVPEREVDRDTDSVMANEAVRADEREVVTGLL